MVYEIANQIGCAPNFEAAKNHLQFLANAEGKNPESSVALIYFDRKSSFFDGKQPAAKCVTAAAEMLRASNYDVRLLTNRSEERRVGKECAILCRSRWSPYH